MPFLAIIFVLELLTAIVIPSLSHSKSAGSKVLGDTILLAQDATPPPDTSSPAPVPDNTAPTAGQSAAVPTDTPAAPAASTVDTPTQEPSPTDTPSPASSGVPTDTPSENISSVPTVSPEIFLTPTPFPTENQETVPTEATSPQESPTSPGETLTPSISPEPTPTPELAAPIFHTDEAITNPNAVDEQMVSDAQKEDVTIQMTTDPEEKAQALTHFASDKVTNIDTFTQDQNFTSAVVANQRLGDQLDQLVSLTKQAAPAIQSTIHQQVSDVCQQANTVLRSAEESVPEEMEQDLEITRGKCIAP